jgi:hypothetical protein
MLWLSRSDEHDRVFPRGSERGTWHLTFISSRDSVDSFAARELLTSSRLRSASAPCACAPLSPARHGEAAV